MLHINTHIPPRKYELIPKACRLVYNTFSRRRDFLSICRQDNSAEFHCKGIWRRKTYTPLRSKVITEQHYSATLVKWLWLLCSYLIKYPLHLHFQVKYTFIHSFIKCFYPYRPGTEFHLVKPPMKLSPFSVYPRCNCWSLGSNFCLFNVVLMLWAYYQFSMLQAAYWTHHTFVLVSTSNIFAHVVAKMYMLLSIEIYKNIQKHVTCKPCNLKKNLHCEAYFGIALHKNQTRTGS